MRSRPSLVSLSLFGITHPACAVNSKDKQEPFTLGCGIPVSASESSLTRIVSSGDSVPCQPVGCERPCLSTSRAAITVSTSIRGMAHSGRIAIPNPLLQNSNCMLDSQACQEA